MGVFGKEVVIEHCKIHHLLASTFQDQKDAHGKAYTRERLQIAKEKGSGWQEYVYKNPANGKVEPKVVYFEKVNELVVSAGAYKP